MQKPRTKESVQLSQQEARKNNVCSVKAMLAYPLHAFFFQLLSEFVGYKAGRGHS